MMVEQEIVRVSEEEYLEKDAADFNEWGDGEFIPTPPAYLDHDALKRKDSHFHRLNETGTYTFIKPNANGDYSTPLLPHFKLPVSTLWVEDKPDTLAIIAAVRAMLAEEQS